MYKHLRNMINTLYEVVEYLSSSLDRYQQITVVDDCLIFIDEITEAIKENESVLSSRLLHSLKELKREINEIKSSSYDKDGIRGNIELVESYFKSDIEIEYKVVFFAELGEKWDAMESVYEAFKNKKNCKVDVVLTPIFRSVNINGEVKSEIIYTDYLTELGIEFFNYKDYDLSKEKPDVAFITNPYESVTLPEFWPENIAKETRLVYLPYYTEMVINENTINVNCQLPVVKHAWKVIAQSEEIKEMHKLYSVRKGENVIVTGLPKWDNQLTTVNEGQSCEKLQDRKVFLWNSHYNMNSPLTIYTSTLLIYAKSIIDIFSRNKEIALIWRPHPMTDTIFKLYLPHLNDFWQECKNIVFQSENMVLDTNKSYTESFACSSALISDISSMIPQYLFTKKPILVLNDASKVQEEFKQIIHFKDLTQAYTVADIEQFVRKVTDGADDLKRKSENVLEKDMNLADGRVGQKVCNIILESLKTE